MAICQVSVLSLMDVMVEIEPPVGVDPSTDAVRLAFIAGGANPTSGDWVTGGWLPEVLASGETRYWAKAPVGPSPGKTLAVGMYQPFVEVTHAATKPVLKSVDLLEIV